jgi:hypothetical protein
MTQPAAPLDLQPAIARDGSTLALTADELETYRYVIGAEADAELAFPVMADTFERLGRLRAQRLEDLATERPTADLAAAVRAELDTAIGDLAESSSWDDGLPRIILDLTRAYTTLASMAAAEAPKPAPPDPERERAARVEAAARAVLEAVATIGHDRLEGAAEPLLNPVLELGEALDFWNPEA